MNAEERATEQARIRSVMTAAVKQYAAMFEAQGGDICAPIDADAVTATEAVTVATELIRAVNLNLFDVAMWFRRPASASRTENILSQGELHG